MNDVPDIWWVDGLKVRSHQGVVCVCDQRRFKENNALVVRIVEEHNANIFIAHPTNFVVAGIEVMNEALEPGFSERLGKALIAMRKAVGDDKN